MIRTINIGPLEAAWSWHNNNKFSADGVLSLRTSWWDFDIKVTRTKKEEA